MEINITLVSTKKYILIGIIGIFLMIPTIIITSVFKNLQPFIFIGIFVVGCLSIYFLLKKFSRFIVTVVVNHEYIKVGEKYTIYWDAIKSYQYSDTGLMVAFIFTTADKTFNITSYKKGPEGEKFKLIKENIFKILEERASDPGKGKIAPYNFYTTKAGKITSYITLAICLMADLFVIYLIITSHHKLNARITFDIVILGLFTILLVGRVYSNRNKSV